MSVHNCKIGGLSPENASNRQKRSAQEISPHPLRLCSFVICNSKLFLGTLHLALRTFLLRFGFFEQNGEIRAHNLAEFALGASINIYYNRVVTFHLKDIFWAELNTDGAPLAPLFLYDDPGFRFFQATSSLLSFLCAGHYWNHTWGKRALQEH